jgi:predicted DNA-binding transcriptional regulator YafY
MVAKLGDAAIKNAASDVMAKIASVVPQDLLPYMAEPAVSLKPGEVTESLTIDTRPLRLAIREGRKMQIVYRAANGEVTSRIVWPVLLGYADAHCLLIAWCQSKQAFRHFRTERILSVEILGEAIGMSKGKLRQQWQLWREAELARSRSAL